MGASLRIPIASARDWPNALASYLAPPSEGGKEGDGSSSGNGIGDGLWLHAADARPSATPYYEVDWSRGRHALVVGAEAAGLSPWLRNAADATESLSSSSSAVGDDNHDLRVDYVSIPLAIAPHSLSPLGPGDGASGPAVESLNAAVAGSIVLCEAHRQIIIAAE